MQARGKTRNAAILNPASAPAAQQAMMMYMTASKHDNILFRLSVMKGLTQKVSDRSQPPLTFDLSLSESAGSDSLHRLVRHLLSFVDRRSIRSLLRSPASPYTRAVSTAAGCECEHPHRSKSRPRHSRPSALTE